MTQKQVEKVFISLLVATAIISCLTLFCQCLNKVVVKKISNGKFLTKDVKTGTDKIIYYDTTNGDFNYVAEGDTLTYSVRPIQLSTYKKSKVVDFGDIKPNSDSVYARKQRELFNWQLQQMAEKQK